MPITIETFPNGIVQTNTYIIKNDQGEAIIIDPASPSSALAAELKDENLTLTHILLTHAHFDHIGGIDMLSELFPGAKLMLHEKEVPSLQDGVLNRSGFFGRKAVHVSTRPFALLKDGDVLETPVGKIKVLFTPGHTPGGLSYYLQEANCVFTGDTLFFSSVGRTDFDNSSFEDLEKGIRENLYLLPDETTAYPGHGPKTGIGHEKKYNDYVRKR